MVQACARVIGHAQNDTVIDDSGCDSLEVFLKPLITNMPASHSFFGLHYKLRRGQDCQILYARNDQFCTKFGL
eukprot:1161401-Pelagomonas_calceolata.AAC.23